MNLRTVAAVSALGLAALSAADQRYFVFTYDWFTPRFYEKEFELTYDHFRGGSGLAQVEFEYGVTDRWVVAPYLLYEQEDGRFNFAGWQLEQRYRFGEHAYRKVLPAIYFEVHKENHEAYELEGKLIGTYQPNDNWIASGNLIVEHKIETGARTEVGYAAGISRIFNDYNIGIEAKGQFLENEHFFGPTLGYVFAPGVKLSVGAGLSFGQGDASRIRLLFEREF